MRALNLPVDGCIYYLDDNKLKYWSFFTYFAPLTNPVQFALLNQNYNS